MILALTFHTGQEFEAVFTGKKIRTDHIRNRIYSCRNVNMIFGYSRTPSISDLKSER